MVETQVTFKQYITIVVFDKALGSAI